MMTWEQVRVMRANGFEIGGHTRRHALLTQEEAPRAREEIEGSYADLITHLGPGEYGFAYPNGSQNEAVRAWVRASGYGYACGMNEVLCGAGADLFDLPRRDVNTLKTTWPDGRFCAALFEATIQDLWGAFRAFRRSGAQVKAGPALPEHLNTASEASDATALSDPQR